MEIVLAIAGGLVLIVGIIITITSGESFMLSLIVIILPSIIIALVLFGLAKILSNQRSIISDLYYMKKGTRKLITDTASCEKCGKEYENDYSSCPHCGHKP